MMTGDWPTPRHMHSTINSIQQYLSSTSAIQVSGLIEEALTMLEYLNSANITRIMFRMV